MRKKVKNSSGRKSQYRNRAQVSMYMESALKRKLQKEAKAHGVSVTNEINARLATTFIGKGGK
jgi:hypothetical protein